MNDRTNSSFDEQVEAEVRRRLGSILRSHETLRQEREDHLKQIQDLRIKLNRANLESLTDRKSRQAALNLMEDAATARSAERREYEDRIRTEEALLEAERQYRTLFESIDEGFCLIEILFDSQRKPVDYRFLEVNPAFEKHTGLANATGKTIRELAIDQDQAWFEIYAKIAITGEPQRFVDYSTPLQRWFDVNAFRIGEPGANKVAVLFSDISNRKKAEAYIAQQSTILQGINRIFAEALTEHAEVELGRVCLATVEDLTGSTFSFMGEINQATGFLDELANSDCARDVFRLDEPASLAEQNPTAFKIHGIYSRVLLDGQAFYTNDPQSHPDRIGTPQGHPQLRCFLGIPLRHDGVTKGMIGLANRRGGYSDAELQVAEAIAPAITQALLRKRAEKALRLAEERQSFLLELSDSLRQLTDALEIQNTAATFVGEYLKVNRVIYFEIENDVALVRGSYEHGVAPLPAKISIADYGDKVVAVCDRGESIVIEDVQKDQTFTAADLEAYKHSEIRAYAAVMLQKQGRCVAAFGIQSSSPRQWKPEEVTLIHEVAERTWEAVERCHAEAELQLREAELARVQQIGRVGGVDIDLTKNHVGKRSPEYRLLHGLADDVLWETHQAWMERIHPDDRVLADQVFRQAIWGTANTYESEYRIIRPSDQQVRWIYAKAHIERDSHRRATRLVGAHIDITERKLAEEALRESEQRFRSLVESYAQAVWETNANGETVHDSASWRAYTGQTLEEWLGFGWINAIHPADRDYVERQWRKSVRQQRNVDAEFRLKHAAGDWRWTQVRATPIRDVNGKITKWSGMNIDIDARKKAEAALKLLNLELDRLVRERTAKLEENEVQLRQRAEQLQEMATQLSRTEQMERRKLSQLLHDHVQQLLVTIKMRLGMLRNSLAGAASQAQLQKIEEILGECINATRTLAVRLLPPLLHDQGLPAALEWLLSRVKIDQGLIVDAEIDEQANPATMESREVLFLAAQEFLLNIVKHSGVSAAQVSLTKNNDIIQLSVSDQGKGFNLTTNQKSFGNYGLYQLRQRLHAINGTLEIESKPLNGSRLIVKLK